MRDVIALNTAVTVRAASLDIFRIFKELVDSYSLILGELFGSPPNLYSLSLNVAGL